MLPRLRAAAGYPLALAAGAFAGWIDLHNHSIIPCALVLFATGAALSFLWPRHAISWVLMLGLSIPATHLIARNVGFVTPYPQQPMGWDFLLPFAPAAAGAGIGILVSFLGGVRLSSREL